MLAELEERLAALEARLDTLVEPDDAVRLPVVPMLLERLLVLGGAFIDWNPIAATAAMTRTPTIPAA